MSKIGHNQDISDQAYEELFYVNLHHYNKALAAKKEADAQMKRVGKVIKGDLGINGMLSIKTFLKAQTEEGAAEIRAENEARAKAQQYAGIKSGYQFDLLEDRTPIVDRAFADGRRDGLLGKTLHNPFNEASEEGTAYANGWHEGQGVLFQGIKKKEAQSDELIKGSEEEDEEQSEVEQW